MKRHSTPGVLGIVGGGQLGRMSALVARRLGVSTVVLDPDPACACAGVADTLITGDFKNPSELLRLAGLCDHLTFEIEHVAADALERLAGGAPRIVPSPSVLTAIQDKLEQKKILRSAGVDVTPYEAAERPESFDVEGFGLPCVQKRRRGGYDGRGVAVLRAPQDARLPGESLFEPFIDVEMEPAVIVALADDGRTEVYPTVETSFEPALNVCDRVIAPARLDGRTSARAVDMAVRAARAFGSPGLYAVEMLLDRSGRLYVNEVAPRPHNSGHFSIEACLTSQFEQHVRLACGLPLGSGRLRSPAVMYNLLGLPGWSGPPVVEGLEEALRVEGLSLHVYGKPECRPFRKMGHFTVCAASLEEALSAAEHARTIVRIRGRNRLAGG